MKNEYKPLPLDTDSITLPDELMELAEDLARNVHEIWAKTRMEQGWKWGEQRDDKNKLHPCLIEYDQLSEEEKLYDFMATQPYNRKTSQPYNR